MEAFGGACVIFCILMAIIFGSGALLDSCESSHFKTFVIQHSDKPFCVEDSAKVLDKQIKLKRCFKAVEIKE